MRKVNLYGMVLVLLMVVVFGLTMMNWTIDTLSGKIPGSGVQDTTDIPVEVELSTN